MEKNKEIMQEFFFKKSEKVSDKLKKKFAYEPLDASKKGQPGFGSILSPGESGLAVTDAKEAGKRVVSALGASLGVNSVKNIAAKSIKSFPIIVSENIEPETSVMLKRVLEEQYAEYISLLISNQIIDISAFKTSEEEGNVAIQALDTVASDDESMQSKLSKGKMSPDELLGNLTAYNLIRNESYKTNNAFLDNLLEGAFIIPSSQENSLLEFYQTFYDDIVTLNEYDERDNKKSSETDRRFVDFSTFLQTDLKMTEEQLKDRKKVFDVLRGREEEDENNLEYINWKARKENIDKRIEIIDAEIIETRNLLKSASANSATFQKENRAAITSAENELERAIAKRGQLAKKTTPNADEIEMQDILVGQIRRKIERLESIGDSGVPNGAVYSLRSIERERDGLIREREHHARQQPKEKTKSERFSRLSTPRVLIDREQMNISLNSSVGEMLLAPKNEFLRDKFEKATFLLESNRIAGTEYIEYLVQRLGIPVGRDVRQRLLTEFRMDQVIDPQNSNNRISRADVRRMSNNQKLTGRSLESLLRTNGRTMLTAILLGTTAAAGTGLATGTITASGIGSLISGLSLGSLMTGAVLTATAGIGVAAITGILMSIFAYRRRRDQKQRKIQGWERVEALIDAMDEQQKSIRTYRVKNPDITQEEEDMLDVTSSELKKVMEDYHDRMGKILDVRPASTPLREDQLPIFDIKFDTLLEMAEETTLLTESILADPDYQAVALSEAVIQTTIPQTLELKYEYDPKKAPDILAAPKFSQRSQYAYGSVEYDKRELKDRRYNAPLLMKVNFKERFSDGTFSDNELTAVIGILGVVTRVPSQEMEHILRSNSEGDTVKGIFSPEGDASKMVSDLLGVDKIKKDVKALPVSGDVWQNLEKVSRLAVSNKLAGRRDNNIANAHIVFAQKEIDNMRANEAIDYVKNIRLVSSLMKRYSAFTVMIANDISERLYIFDDIKATNWDVVPYSAFRNKDTGDQLNAMINKMSSGRL
jgi:hypothetical protein